MVNPAYQAPILNNINQVQNTVPTPVENPLPSINMPNGNVGSSSQNIKLEQAPQTIPDMNAQVNQSINN